MKRKRKIFTPLSADDSLTITFRLSRDAHKAIARVAAQKDMTLAAVIRRCIDMHLKQFAEAG